MTQSLSADSQQSFAAAGGPSIQAVTTQMSLDQNVSEIALHAGVTNFGYTLSRDLRVNTLSLTIITK